MLGTMPGTWDAQTVVVIIIIAFVVVRIKNSLHSSTNSSWPKLNNPHVLATQGEKKEPV